MSCSRLGFAALALLAGATAAWAGPPAAAPKGGDDARQLAERIDHHIGAALERAKVKPAVPANDAAFLRRASLDINGKIPLVHDVRKFLTDRSPSPEKRAAAIERLLESPSYANHMTAVWRDLLLPEATTDLQKRYLIPSMERWLRKQFAANAGYDKLARELVAMPMGNQRDQMAYYRFYDNSGPTSPMTFYLSKEGKPEEIAASVARVFLGVRLECAQCHDHPFGKWTREEFWSQAAFFAGIKGPQGQPFYFGSQLREVSDKREMSIPNTDRVAQARFLDGKTPRWKFKVGARTTLAEWMTARDNPFFAKAAVNRVWAHFFGVGLVEPIDDMNEDNPASHPELLTELAKAFADHDFDLKFLIRAITQSRTYQLSSRYDGPLPDVRLYARMPIKGLTAEQLYDSFLIATSTRDNIPYNQRFFFFGGNQPRQIWMETFAAQEKRTEYHTSIPQALTLMNNQLVSTATHADRGELLGAVASAPFMTTSGRIEALFLAALSRKPTPDESAKFSRYVDKGGAVGNSKKALADVFWALLNSTEFKFNH
jgi:hypothetical protein